MDIVRQAQAEFKHFCVASDGKKFKAIYLIMSAIFMHVWCIVFFC